MAPASSTHSPLDPQSPAAHLARRRPRCPPTSTRSVYPSVLLPPPPTRRSPTDHPLFALRAARPTASLACASLCAGRARSNGFALASRPGSTRLRCRPPAPVRTAGRNRRFARPLPAPDLRESRPLHPYRFIALLPRCTRQTSHPFLSTHRPPSEQPALLRSYGLCLLLVAVFFLGRHSSTLSQGTGRHRSALCVRCSAPRCSASSLEVKQPRICFHRVPIRGTTV